MIPGPIILNCFVQLDKRQAPAGIEIDPPAAKPALGSWMIGPISGAYMFISFRQTGTCPNLRITQKS